MCIPYFTEQSRGPTAPKIKNRMSNFLEPGQTATGTNEEEVRRTESQLGKDLLGEEREKKKQEENYDPPPPQHHTWCYLTSTQLQDYNKRFEESEDTKYEFVKVLKATFSTGGARRYFITFQVKDMADPASPTLNSFRARVYDGFKSETIVEFCAPEP